MHCNISIENPWPGVFVVCVSEILWLLFPEMFCPAVTCKVSLKHTGYGVAICLTLKIVSLVQILYIGEKLVQVT